MRLAGEAQAELIKIAAIGLLALGAVWAVRAAFGAAKGALADPFDDLLSAPGKAWEAVKDAAAAAVSPVVAVVDQTRAAAPGAGLPAGWYTVKTRFGAVVTRNPDAFKTINPYDTLGLIDP